MALPSFPNYGLAFLHIRPKSSLSVEFCILVGILGTCPSLWVGPSFGPIVSLVAHTILRIVQQTIPRTQQRSLNLSILLLVHTKLV